MFLDLRISTYFPMKTISGLLSIDKPEGMTSRQTVTRVKNLLRKAGYGRQIKVGHCGTLDPLATGILVICVGRSTRLVQMIQVRYRERFLGSHSAAKAKAAPRGRLAIAPALQDWIASRQHDEALVYKERRKLAEERRHLAAAAKDGSEAPRESI